MLQVGNPGLTTAENRAHFSFWALLAAPLMAGNDVRQMAPDVRDILLNREVIAVNQDPLGRQGKKIRDDGDLEVWSKPLQGDARAVILFNRGKADATISVSWQEIGLPYDAAPNLRDLWQKKDLGPVKGTFTATVPTHDVVLIKVG
jgi:alpha-galactosidase